MCFPLTGSLTLTERTRWRQEQGWVGTWGVGGGTWRKQVEIRLSRTVPARGTENREQSLERVCLGLFCGKNLSVVAERDPFERERPKRHGGVGPTKVLGGQQAGVGQQGGRTGLRQQAGRWPCQSKREGQERSGSAYRSGTGNRKGLLASSLA